MVTRNWLHEQRHAKPIRIKNIYFQYCCYYYYYYCDGTTDCALIHVKTYFTYSTLQWVTIIFINILAPSHWRLRFYGNGSQMTTTTFGALHIFTFHLFDLFSWLCHSLRWIVFRTSTRSPIRVVFYLFSLTLDCKSVKMTSEYFGVLKVC